MPRRRLLALVAGLVAAAALPADAALAHIQVRPATAAPGDPVLWTVLVPAEEEDVGTSKVEVAVPAGVLPFSFEDVAGWKRKNNLNPDGSIKSITWTGKSAGDGLATFRFLASTPEKPGPISWKALQTYEDGKIVRWIGAPGSENPASVTVVSASAPRENAGGESPGTASPPAGTAKPEVATASSDDGDSADWLARALGIAAILIAAGVVLVLVTRTRRKES
jgi:uncharacterized protein YcnI